MADDPALELQRSLVAALKGDATLDALIDGRVRDLPEQDIAFPYVTVGGDFISASLADCYAGSDVTVNIHAWSRAQGFPEVKQIASAIRGTLHDASFEVDGFRLVDLSFDGSRFMRDPDGLTSHAVLTFRAMLEPID